MNTSHPEFQNLKVVLAHDWLTGMRGGERVLEYLCRMFPQAPIYTLFYNPGAISDTIRSHPVKTSWLQNIPGITKYYRNFLPLFPSAMEKMRPEKADLVISTSHCVAKGLNTPKGARHLCYCFTPMRYAWVFYDEYFGGNPVKKTIMEKILRRLREWDAANSRKIDCFVTLSKHVRKRINDFYGRESEVVYPPVNLDFWKPEQNSPVGPLLAEAVRSDLEKTARCKQRPYQEQENYDLLVSALVPYKRIDLAVQAYTKLGYPLKIVGTGTETAKLRKMAGKNISFLGRLSDEELLVIYRHCRALIFPGEEDFGLVPLEAQACGKPVVAFGRGGLIETVINGQTGVFFEEQTEESLLGAVAQCSSKKWDPAIIRKNAGKFSEENFIDGIKACIEKCLK